MLLRITRHEHAARLPREKFNPVNKPRRIQRSFQLLLLLGLCLVSSALTARAQDDTRLSTLNAPPPVKSVAPEDRAQLSDVRDLKARTRLSLELAETHLRNAEELAARHDYEATTTELGRYQGIIEDALHFLNSTHRDDGKARDQYRKIELALRAHGARLETIRRATPYEYAVNIKEVTDFTRRERTAALNVFYGDTVLREDQEFKPQSAGEHHKNSSAPEPPKP